MPDHIVRCDGCGAFCTQHHYGCDREVDRDWCADCFPTTPCGRGDHGEGCATMIVADGGAE